MSNAVQGRAKLKRTAQGKIAGYLWNSLWQRHKRMMMVSLFLQFIYSAFNFAGPVLLNKVVTFLTSSALYKAEQSAPLVSGSHREPDSAEAARHRALDCSQDVRIGSRSVVETVLIARLWRRSQLECSPWQSPTSAWHMCGRS